MKIYAISGLGADKRVFNYLSLNTEIVYIDWIIPQENESLSSYAKRIAAVINTKEPFGLMGVSFGGLISMEIDKFLKPAFVILISTFVSNAEIPAIFKIPGKLGLFKVVPKMFLLPPKFIAYIMFGVKNKVLFNNILNDTDLSFVKWALIQIVKWDNDKLPKNVLRIHGNKDKVIPIRNFESIEKIKNGEHFMIVDNADELSKVINSFISVFTKAQ